ncbi:MAG: hypothetical protein WC196_05680 [Bacilli bacterium]|jgi:hypothetical protein
MYIITKTVMPDRINPFSLPKYWGCADSLDYAEELLLKEYSRVRIVRKVGEVGEPKEGWVYEARKENRIAYFYIFDDTPYTGE